MSTHTSSNPSVPRPYGDHAAAYHAAGWSPLPLPAGQKAHPPKGWTGYNGAVPSHADVHAWAQDQPGGNLALRLPPGIIGLDVDAYGDKIGGPVFAALQEQYGALPDTWRSTSRDDGTSGIRLYRAPQGLAWPTEAGPGIEIIRHEHRYMVVWPSLHPSGGTYRWINPHGSVVVHDIPDPDDLPDLPEAWVQHLTGGRVAGEHHSAGMDDTQARQWLADHGGDAPCNAMSRALQRAMEDLARTGSGSRHDAMLRATNRLAWLAATGHDGLETALHTYQGAWLSTVGTDRASGEAAAEWDRAVTGAADRAAAGATAGTTDPCTTGVGSLIAHHHEETPCEPPSASSPPASPAPAEGASAGSTTTPPPVTGASTADTAATDGAPGDPEPERSSWWPDTEGLWAALNGDQVDPPPVALTRSDGKAAWYAGKVNGIIGPSESGKSWIALVAVVQAVTAGQRVTILDFEDSVGGIANRLSKLGLDAQRIASHVAYINPDEPLVQFAQTAKDIAEHMHHWKPQLVVVDGVNAAMTLQGLDLMSNKDATEFSQRILSPLTRDGATVVYIDHVAKSSENGTAGGIGAQSKRAMTSGCTLRVEVIDQWGQGQDGMVRLRVDKDRPGHVRGASAPGKNGHWFADVHISSTEGGGVLLDVKAPLTLEEAQRIEDRKESTECERISAYLVAHPGASGSAIHNALGGRKKEFFDRLNRMERDGFVAREGAGSSVAWRVLREYSAEAVELSRLGGSDASW